METAKATSKYLRISPRKARYAAGLVRGLTVQEAAAQLKFSHLKGGSLLKKTLDSAVANAENNYDMRRENLKIVEVFVNEGPTMKRAKPKNKGGSHSIMKRTSHITVVVGE
ncbi:MAG: 50S ribosomal protein L22 [Chlamydiia bacterium]|nr:50S ribosomal protein L22 [Chlamydiia bacterium]